MIWAGAGSFGTRLNRFMPELIWYLRRYPSIDPSDVKLPGIPETMLAADTLPRTKPRFCRL